MTKPFSNAQHALGDMASLMALQQSFVNRLQYSNDLNRIIGIANIFPKKPDLSQIYRAAGFGPFDIMLKELQALNKISSNFNWIAPLVHQLQANHLKSLEGISALSSSMSRYKNNQISQHIKSLVGLETGFFGLTHKIASAALATGRTADLQSLSDISDDASSIKDRVVEQQYVTKADLDALKNIYEAYVKRIENLVTQRRWVQIVYLIAFILDLVSNIDNVKRMVVDNYQPPAETITLNDLEKFKREVFDSLSAFQSEESFEEKRYTRVRLNLRSKPRINCHVVDVLPEGQEVIILQTHGKWAQVSTTDSEDDLVIYGWVYKKYLTKRQPD